MIYSITGRLRLVEPSYAVVETSGIGYKCTTSTTTLAQLSPEESQVTLFTYLHVREDNLELFGFATQEELACFKLLISVSGVGPKAALAILSTTSPQRLMLSIAAGDVSALKAPGVGPKLTQRILLELQDKVGSEQLNMGISASTIGKGVSASAGAPAEAISALVALGYNQTAAASVVMGLDLSLPADELVKASLRKLSKGV